MPTLEEARQRVRQLRLAAKRKRLNIENKPPSVADDEASFFEQSAEGIETAIKEGEFKTRKNTRKGGK